jgi:hypothetical protein
VDTAICSEPLAFAADAVRFMGIESVFACNMQKNRAL